MAATRKPAKAKKAGGKALKVAKAVTKKAPKKAKATGVSREPPPTPGGGEGRAALQVVADGGCHPLPQAAGGAVVELEHCKVSACGRAGRSGRLT